MGVPDFRTSRDSLRIVEPETRTTPSGAAVALRAGMDPRGAPELDVCRPNAAASEEHARSGDDGQLAPGETGDAIATVARALQEHTRRAQTTIVAIDHCIMNVVRVLAARPGGIREAQRRAAALGLHRLQHYLERWTSAMEQRTGGNQFSKDDICH